jgi:hypothetical protein
MSDKSDEILARKPGASERRARPVLRLVPHEERPPRPAQVEEAGRQLRKPQSARAARPDGHGHDDDPGPAAA